MVAIARTAVSYALLVWAANPVVENASKNLWKLQQDPLWASDTPTFVALTFVRTGEVNSDELD